MATLHVVTEKKLKVEAQFQFRLVCRGVSKTEFTGLYRAFKNDFGCKTVLHNPFPSGFDAKAVHEIIARATEIGIGGYAAKKGIDAAEELFVAFVKYKFMASSVDGHVRHVQLYGPNNRPLYDFKDNRNKPKKK